MLSLAKVETFISKGFISSGKSVADETPFFSSNACILIIMCIYLNLFIFLQNLYSRVALDAVVFRLLGKMHLSMRISVFTTSTEHFCFRSES